MVGMLWPYQQDTPAPAHLQINQAQAVSESSVMTVPCQTTLSATHPLQTGLGNGTYSNHGVMTLICTP